MRNFFLINVALILYANYVFGNVPIDRLNKQVSWLLPLRIEASYTPIAKGQILTLGWETVNIDALVQRGINKNTLVVLYYDNATSRWVKVPQILVEYPNEGSNVGNVIWDYGPYVGHDVIYFKAQETIKPLTVCDRYVLVSVDDTSLRSLAIMKKKLSMDLLFRMTDDGGCTNEGWYVERTNKSSCRILPVKTRPYYPQPVSIEYRGISPESHSRVLSKSIPVKPGDKIEWRVIWQVKKFPIITMDSLPGKKYIKRPGDAESRVPRIIWNVLFKDKAGKPIKKAPSYWRRVCGAHNNPVEVVGHFTVPANASTYQYVFTIGGKGEIEFDVLDILVYRQLGPKARDYNIYDAGKVFFPQIEIRKSSGGVFNINKGITVWLSPELNKLSEKKKKILLDGLRNYQPVVGNSDSSKLRISLLDKNLQLPAEITNNQKLKEQVRNLPAEGYVLSISSTGVSIWARDCRGAFYAVQELGERLRTGKGKTFAAIIVDWPELKWRFVHHELLWNSVKHPKEYYEKWIPELARLRINGILLQERRAWYHLKDPKVRKYWNWLFGLCRKWNITPIPMGYNFRNSMPVYEAIWLTAGKWVEDEPYILRGLKPAPLRPKCDAFRFRPLRRDSNLLPDKNGNFPVIPMLGVDNPIIVKSADGKIQYQMGKDFLIEGKVKWRGDRLPFISIKLEKPFIIRRTKNSRIPDGAKILLSYNYLYRVRGWHNETYSTCISSRYAKDIANNALRDTVRYLHPTLIHLGQDEVVGIGRDGRDIIAMRKQKCTPGKLFADLLNRFKRTARSTGFNGQFLVWHDGLTPLNWGWMQSYNGPYYTCDAINYISPKDFIINVWIYGNLLPNPNIPDYFLNKGFSIAGAANVNRDGIIGWCYYLATRQLNHKYSGQIKGLVMTRWYDPNKTAFRSRRDLARLSWNTGPWVQYDIQYNNEKIYVYDIYYEPTTIKINGKYAELIPAKSLPTNCQWLAWQCGYAYCANIPANITSDDLTVEVENKAVCKSRDIIVRTDEFYSKKIKLVILGDSTVQTYPHDSVLAGWGQVIGKYFTKDVGIHNYARSGRSSKTFIQEGLLDKAIRDNADYTLIQFGHNDDHGKSAPESTDANSDYKDYLREYVKRFRKVGTKVIFVTPMCRMVFRNGKLYDTLQPYANAMKQVALETNCTVLDLHEASKQLFTKLGPKGCKQFQTGRPKDLTHFCLKGADMMAKLIVQQLVKSNSPLKNYVTYRGEHKKCILR